MDTNTHPPRDQHGFVLSGTAVVHGSHLAMFDLPQHRYQVVAQLDLPEDIRNIYTGVRRNDPDTPVVVINPADRPMSLQDMLKPDGFRSELWRAPDHDLTRPEVLAARFTVRATRVLHSRTLDDHELYPPIPRCLVFGAGGEAYAAHHVTHRPDYQLLVELAALPADLTAAQLGAGILVDLVGLAEDHKPASDPLEPYRDQDVEAEITETGAPVTLRIGPTRWFDTHHLNHEPNGHHTTLTEYLELARV